MMKNYEFYRNLGNLSDGFMLEDVKRYLYKNVFICRVGVVKEFDSQTQKGTVVIEEYEDLDILTCNISALRLELQKGDKVILLQSSINIFNEKDDNYFDKHYFYILNAVNLEFAGINLQKFNINTKELTCVSEETSLRSKNVVCEGANTKISLKSLIIEADDIQLKGNVYINGKLFESHMHGVGTMTYVNAGGAPTLVTGNTSGVS
ncbi:DUF777 family protein (plasmid) [Borrelia miyamotoi]|uniref:DUF777 family protein n=1 Tax=Borrelia miyamotoi TaxID=47466 RepID=A0AAP9CG65_9SPIR|nr:DUF777 family protein [Borrelia miyamotoi]MBW6186650.1 DUF777 family protein [Pseudomonas aeruginosa]ATQ15250.1 DUF777 family protein [Borrelia miyamotoi]ATQ16438.1 DUF777 family protein [Borrelia miyamotoi]ATQ17579.1 DUF777 family protein [Borrelia miyamotoi]ATQ18823.1 DUF777 family protein [Borrelia miyamotoi]